MLDEIDLDGTVWQERASCAGMSDVFIDGIKPEADVLNTVMRICARCPVRDECGAYAVATSATWGVWGGVWRGAIKFRKAAAA